MTTAGIEDVLELRRQDRASLYRLDVADGQAVRLVQGRAGSETVYGPPIDAARACAARRGGSGSPSYSMASANAA